MSTELWKAVFDWGTVILIGLTFAFGAGALITGNKLNERQEEQSKQFEKDLTEAKTKLGEQQERAAAAEKDLKDVDTKTEGFRLAIAQANERAAKAQGSLATAEQHAAEANAKAEGFRLDIAKANERAASANEIAERERLARIQLEARLADRVLMPDAQSRLTAFAASFPHGTRIDICVFGGTLEIANITQSINNSLTAGGWTVRQWQVTGGGAVRGILIGTNPTDAAAAMAASGIISTLVTAGVGAGPWKFDELVVGGMLQGSGDPMDAPIRMFIGSKQ